MEGPPSSTYVVTVLPSLSRVSHKAF
jgi:hypothetical protein